MTREEIQAEYDKYRNQIEWAQSSLKMVENDPYYNANPEEQEKMLQHWKDKLQSALKQKRLIIPLLLHALEIEKKEADECIVIL